MSEVLSSVTRWAPLIVETGRNAGLPDQLIGPYTAEMMAMMHRESRGNPDAQNKAGRGPHGAYGLWQFITKWYKTISPASTAREQAQRAADAVIKTQLPNTGGNIPSAVTAFAAGGGALAGWVNGDDSTYFAKKSAPNVRRAHAPGGPVDSYAAWYATWASKGFPVVTATIERKSGKSETYQLAAAVGPVTVKPFSTGYAGKLCWQNKCRTVSAYTPPSYITRIPAPPGNGVFLKLARTAKANPYSVPVAIALVTGIAGFFATRAWG